MIRPLEADVKVLEDQIVVYLMNRGEAAIWFDGCTQLVYVSTASLSNAKLAKLTGIQEAANRPLLNPAAFSDLKLDRKGKVALTLHLRKLEGNGEEQDFGAPLRLTITNQVLLAKNRWLCTT